MPKKRKKARSKESLILVSQLEKEESAPKSRSHSYGENSKNRRVRSEKSKKAVVRVVVERKEKRKKEKTSFKTFRSARKGVHPSRGKGVGNGWDTKVGEIMGTLARCLATSCAHSQKAGGRRSGEWRGKTR